MANKDKQIKEIARDLGIAFQLAGTTSFGEVAGVLVNAGYRKASEVAREIFEENERFLVEKLSSINAFRKKGDSFYDGEIHALELLLYKNAELKKKYTEGEG